MSGDKKPSLHVIDGGFGSGIQVGIRWGGKVAVRIYDASKDLTVTIELERDAAVRHARDVLTASYAEDDVPAPRAG